MGEPVIPSPAGAHPRFFAAVAKFERELTLGRSDAVGRAARGRPHEDVSTLRMWLVLWQQMPGQTLTLPSGAEPRESIAEQAVGLRVDLAPCPVHVPWSAQAAFNARSRLTALGEDLRAVFLDD